MHDPLVGPPFAAEPLRYRLGFAVRPVGNPALRTHDGRRQGAHLSVSLIYLRDILHYMERIGVTCYRVASDILPLDGAAFAQLADCAAELDLIADQVQACGVRLSMHLPIGLGLGSSDGAVGAKSMLAIEGYTTLLARLQGEVRAGSLVAHIGGAAQPETFDRFIARYTALSTQARAQLVIEHEGSGISLGHLLRLHLRCGVPIVFDRLHWQLFNPEHLPESLALGFAFATWPSHARPKVHLSSARSEAHLIPPRGNEPARILPPRYGQHADFVQTSDLQQLLTAAVALPAFDIMIEARAADLALQRLRTELAQQKKRNGSDFA